MARGIESQHNPARRVDRESGAYGLAADLHYNQNFTASDLRNLPDPQWAAINKGRPAEADRGTAYHVMRALENYAPDTNAQVPSISAK